MVYISILHLGWSKLPNPSRVLPRLPIPTKASQPIPTKAAQLERSAYASLREFIHGAEDNARLDIAKARKNAHREGRAGPSSSEFVFFAQKVTQVQSPAGDADVQWVLKGEEYAWLDAMKSAPKA